MADTATCGYSKVLVLSLPSTRCPCVQHVLGTAAYLSFMSAWWSDKVWLGRLDYEDALMCSGGAPDHVTGAFGAPFCPSSPPSVQSLPECVCPFPVVGVGMTIH